MVGLLIFLAASGLWLLAVVISRLAVPRWMCRHCRTRESLPHVRVYADWLSDEELDDTLAELRQDD